MSCGEILGNFAIFSVLSCGEKLSPKVHLWSKNDKYQVWPTRSRGGGPRGSGVGFQGPRRSGVGLQGPRGQGIGFQGPRGSGVGPGPRDQGGGVRCSLRLAATFDGSSDD